MTARRSTPGRASTRATRFAGTLPTGRHELFLVDTSAWARQSREQVVADRLAAAHDEGQIVLALPIVLELGFSARNPKEHERLMAELATFPVLPLTDVTSEIAVGLQAASWHGGLVRAAGAVDAMIAAVAIQYSATVLHHDHDVEHLAAVDSRLRHEWVAPPGALP